MTTVSVSCVNRDAYLRWIGKNKPTDGHLAPMWHGWVVPKTNITVVVSESPRHYRSSRLLHELAHAVCGMDESDTIEWEVYAACALWGRGSRGHREVVAYQAHSFLDATEAYETGLLRRLAHKRFRENLPPTHGPDPRPLVCGIRERSAE